MSVVTYAGIAVTMSFTSTWQLANERKAEMSDYGAVTIALKDGRCVNVDNDGHVTVWDADGEVERELDV